MSDRPEQLLTRRISSESDIGLRRPRQEKTRRGPDAFARTSSISDAGNLEDNLKVLKRSKRPKRPRSVARSRRPQHEGRPSCKDDSFNQPSPEVAMLNEEGQDKALQEPEQITKEVVSFDDMFPRSQQNEQADPAPPPDETGEEGEETETSMPVMFGRRHQSFHQINQEKNARERTGGEDNADESGGDDFFQPFKPQYVNDNTEEGDEEESSIGMFSQPQVGAFDSTTDDPSSPGAGVLGMSLDAIGSSILGMPMSILGSVPEVTAPPIKKKNMRLIVRRAYRNKYTDHLYCFDEGRRLIVVPTTVSMGELKEECSRVLRNHEVLEVLINEQGRTRAIKDIRFLCNLDEIVAVTDGPDDTYPCCGKVLEALNIGRPDHKPLIEVDGLSNTSSIASRAASQIAIVVQRMNSTSPVQEKGSLEIRKMSRGWGKVAGKVFDERRPFFVYPWKASLTVDLQIMVWMIGLPLMMGLSMVFIPFNPEVMDSRIDEHNLYTYIGMTVLGVATALFINSWIGFYFFIHMSAMSYILAAIALPPLSIGLYIGLSKVMFPFYNSPICIMLITTAVVYVMAYPHMPRRLRMKKDLKKDLGNSMVIMDFLILVFVVNRLMVLNFGQRDALSLFVLSAMYPLLVTRSTSDCARLAEAFNRKTVAVVEAFFTFVSSVFQMIVFLAIDAKVKPILIFIIINLTDIGCLLLSGPLISFFRKKNRTLMKKHRDCAEEEGFNEGLEVFIRWVKDPLKLQPLLVKCYCESSAKFVFIILSLLIRFGSPSGAYPFIHDVRKRMFTEAVYFTAIELCMWVIIQYSVEWYLRINKCQYMLHKEKKNMLSIANILGFNNGFITVLLLLQQTPASGA